MNRYAALLALVLPLLQARSASADVYAGEDLPPPETGIAVPAEPVPAPNLRGARASARLLLAQAPGLRPVPAAAVLAGGGLPGLIGGAHVDPIRAYLKERSRFPAEVGGVPAAASAAAAELDLAQALDGHWKTHIRFTLGGKTAHISGSFDRDQNAYLSVWVEGTAEPRFFNIRGLLDRAGAVSAGNATYNISLLANALKPMKSQIVFENAANEDDVQTITVKDLLAAVRGAGTAVALGAQSYQVFYYRDIKPGNPASLDTRRTFAFILTEGEEMHVFLIPEELVPEDRVAVFKMHQDKRVGLKRAGGKLQIHDNP